ncbi:MAG: DNA adenine methylase [Ardenticatenaceae bacterium]|nr:DNA adenine methylase [Ardenticatenaceae bacterium]MCB9443740.1 DNA adenine methylase [Ardenticatenaceae bacterium]
MSDEYSYVNSTAPFLKWAGGKQRLLTQYQPFFPTADAIGHYFEPFIGSAAVFFQQQYPVATLSDQNGKLIEVYQQVRDDLDQVFEALAPHRNEPDYYYEVRSQNPVDLVPAERAARLIYLNKTCYNGLYRENSKGEFNVPFGRYKNPKICDEVRLRAASAALRGVNLKVADFAEAVATAVANDFVYFDPPYVPLSPTSSFTNYHKNGFGQADQERLADVVAELTKRNVMVMLSNSSAPLVYELYGRSSYRIIDIQARRNINSKAGQRGPVKELLILNY